MMCQQVIRGPVLNVLDSFNTFQAKNSPFHVEKNMIQTKYVTEEKEASKLSKV